MKKILFIIFAFTFYYSVFPQSERQMSYEISKILKEGAYSFNLLYTSVKIKNQQSNIHVDPYLQEIKTLNKSKNNDAFSSGNAIAKIDLKPVSIIKYEIAHKDTLIELKPNEIGLPAVIVNLSSNTVNLEGKLLNFSSPLFIENTENSLQSKWSGFKWQGNDAVECKFVIGKLENTGEIYMEIKGYYGEYPNEGYFHYRLLG